MFKDYWKYDWVLPVYGYEGLEPLLTTLAGKALGPEHPETNVTRCNLSRLLLLIGRSFQGPYFARATQTRRIKVSSNSTYNLGANLPC
jgi:hypothetical protein